MFTGTAVFDMLLPEDSRSLKGKRSYIRPIIAALRKIELAAAEVGDMDRHGRSQIGVAVVASEHKHAQRVLDSAEQLVSSRPEIELLSVGRRIFGPED